MTKLPVYSEASSVRDDIYHMLAEANDMIPFDFAFKYKQFTFYLFTTDIMEPYVEIQSPSAGTVEFDLTGDENENELVIMDIMAHIS